MNLRNFLEAEGVSPEEFILNTEKVLKGPDARFLVWVILAKTGYFSRQRPENIEFQAGQRDVGQFIMEILDEFNKDFLAVMREDSLKRDGRKKEDTEKVDLYEPEEEGGGDHVY